MQRGVLVHLGRHILPGVAEHLPLAPPRPGTTVIRHARETIVPLADIANLTMNGNTLPTAHALSRAA